MSIEQTIRKNALEAGFDFCGFASLDPLTADAERLRAWLAAGYHADMRWMERNTHLRRDPRLLVPEAQSAVVLLSGYYHPMEPRGDQWHVARYARFRSDYHDVLRDRLLHLSSMIDAEWQGAALRHYTDTGPVLERALAVRAGLGWIGRNNCLIVPGAGSYYFISVLFTKLELQPDLPPMSDHCPPSCHRCLEACPAGALVEPRLLDSDRCLAYHTIENKGEIAPEVAAVINNRVFGCDICQEVCPWNRHPRLPRVPVDEINGAAFYRGDQWPELTHEQFLSAFRKTPLHRTGYKRLMRNVEACVAHKDTGI